MISAPEKARIAAQKFAKEEDWKYATVCMLACVSTTQRPVRAVDIAREFATLGCRVDPGIIYESLEALVDDGILGYATKEAA